MWLAFGKLGHLHQFQHVFDAGWKSVKLYFMIGLPTETEEDMRKTAEGYAFQMDHYARAAARLLGLPPGQITSLLLFSRKGWIWTQGNAAKKTGV